MGLALPPHNFALPSPALWLSFALASAFLLQKTAPWDGSTSLSRPASAPGAGSRRGRWPSPGRYVLTSKSQRRRATRTTARFARENSLGPRSPTWPFPARCVRSRARESERELALLGLAKRRLLRPGGSLCLPRRRRQAPALRSTARPTLTNHVFGSSSCASCLLPSFRPRASALRCKTKWKQGAWMYVDKGAGRDEGPAKKVGDAFVHLHARATEWSGRRL